MTNYYLDIETSGLDPYKDKIITIQYQKLDRYTGAPIGDLHILKEWNETSIIDEFIRKTNVTNSYKFDFIPVGMNLNFEHSFLHTKNNSITIRDRPQIDVKSLLVLMNKGEFKNSGLDKMIGKKESGENVPYWYETSNYDRIVEYIQEETEKFLEFLQWLYKEMPMLWKKYENTI